MRRTEGRALPTLVVWVATLLVMAGAAALSASQLPGWEAISPVDQFLAAAPLLALALLLTSLVVTWRGSDRQTSERARRAEDRVETLAGDLPDLLFYDANERGKITYVSDGCRTLLGFEPREMVGRSLVDYTPDAAIELLPATVGETLTTEGAWAHADGTTRTLQLVSHRRAESGHAAFRGSARDVGARVAAEQELRETHQSFLDMLASAQNGILVVSSRGKILIFNPALCDLLGYEPHAMERLSLADVTADPSAGSLMPLVTARIWGSAPPGLYERQIVRSDGELRDVEVSISTYPLGESERSAWIEFSDVTNRKRDTERIQQLAGFEVPTGLPNRQRMERAIADALARAAAEGGTFAVMLMDLDRFKLVNDTLGHTVGDELLQQVAERFVQAVPKEHIVARFGGDEFLVLAPDLADLESAMDTTGSLVASLSTPLEVGGRSLHTATSVGVAVFPHDGEDAATLIRRADSAMYRAKELGGSGYQFATASLDADSRRRLNVENDLRAAIVRGELRVYYHPEVDIETGRIANFEALVRWEHPDHGLLPPADFVPILEDNGLIRLVDAWVLRQACQQNRRWRDDGLGPVIVSVNLSARLFSNGGMIDTIKAVLAETGLSPELLELEVTETAALENIEEAVAMLRQIRELGVRTALDDFGTGHSSLVRLKEFPLSTLKIDGSFVQSVTTDEDSGSIVSGVIALGHALGLTVVAEGVEHERQLSLLRHLGCDLAQGYLFARPLTEEAATSLLADQRRLGHGFAA